MFVNSLLVFLTALLLGFQLIWSVKLDLKVDRATILYGLFIGLVIGEIALVSSFVPLKSTIVALFLASSYYSLSGLIYSYLDQRLFKETIRSYISVWMVVFAIMFLSIQW